jgi:putative transposase
MALLYIQHGNPNQEAFIERFNRSFREEVLNANLSNMLSKVLSIADARLPNNKKYRRHESLGYVPRVEVMQRVPKTEASSFRVPACEGSLRVDEKF